MNVKKKNLYWLIIGALGFFHLQSLLEDVIPIFVSIFFILGIVFYLYRTVLLQVENLPFRWNLILVVLQVLVLLLSLLSSSIWMSFILFVLFISLEIIRTGWSKGTAELARTIDKHEEQLEQINETFRVVRSERHDFLKHVSAIHFMLENKKELEAKVYLDELVDSYEETNFSIKGESGVVAGVLHQAYIRAKKLNVDLIYDLDVPLSTLPLPDQKMVTLIGNLLTNSIDASEEWQKKSRKQATVTVQFYKRSGLYILKCKNNSLQIPTKVLDELFHTYGKTTKGGSHEGLGTKVIKEIVEEHQGFLDFVYKEEEFEVKIKIPAIK